MKKNKTFQIVVSIGMVLFAFAITIIANSISFTKPNELFSISKFITTLKNPVFWIQLSGMALLLECSYIGSYTARDAVNKSSSEYCKILDEYETVIKQKNNNYNDFIECIRLKNFELKKEEYIAKYERLRIKYLTQYNKIPNEKLLQPKSVKIKAKLDKTNWILTSPELDKDILRSNVKYHKIHIEDFGRVVSDNIKSKYDFKNRQNEKFTFSAIFKFINKVLWAAIFSAVSLQAFWSFNFGSGFWITISSCGLGCIMTISSGISIADKLYSAEAVSALCNRIAFINEDFKSYMAKNNKSTYEERFKKAVTDKVDELIKANNEKLSNTNVEKVSTTHI